MNKIKLKDKVIILSGKDKGKVGIVSKVFKDRTSGVNFIVVEGLNLVKKHSRAMPNKNKPGGIISIERPIICSKVSLFCDSLNKRSRVFFNILDSGKKVRFFKLNKEVIS